MSSFVFRYPLLAGVASLLLSTPTLAQNAPQADSLAIRRIYDEALLRGQSYENLRHLTGHIGGPPRGFAPGPASRGLEQGNDGKAGCRPRVFAGSDGAALGARRQGKRSRFGLQRAKASTCRYAPWAAQWVPGANCGQVVEVQSLDELAALPEEKVKGKFVFFNRPMNPTHIEPGKAYGGAGDQRRAGASAPPSAEPWAPWCAPSAWPTTTSRTPAPCATTMAWPKCPPPPSAPTAPTVSVSSSRPTRTCTFELEMACQTLPDVKSYNVIGEIKGSKYPDEIITVGGHLDSWDLGQGAHDDGTGCVQSMEVLRLLKATGLKPERTVRAVHVYERRKRQPRRHQIR